MPNYFAPAFRIEVDGATLAADVSKNIQEVSVTSEPNSMDSFSLTLVNEYPLMRWTHTGDAKLFAQGSVVKIFMGYVDDLQEMIEGEITQISPNFPASGTPTINIDGHSRMHWLHASKSTRTFTQMTDKQIVEKVASDAGLQAQADDTGEQFDYIIQNNQTDLEFLRDRASRIHFQMVVKEKTLFFQKSNEGSPKIYTFVWGHTQAALAAGPNSLPLKSFATTMNTLKPPTKVQVRGYDRKNKKEIVANANAGEESNKMAGEKTGSEVVSSTFRKPRDRVLVNIPVDSQAEADQRAKALLNSLGLEFITGNASTIGVPDIRSGAVVELQGLGPAFSGTYYIDKAVHTIGGNGYSTDLTVKRNSTNGPQSS
jgi:phage protein D